jgi:hypothetical protein
LELGQDLFDAPAPADDARLSGALLLAAAEKLVFSAELLFG